MFGRVRRVGLLCIGAVLPLESQRHSLSSRHSGSSFTLLPPLNEPEQNRRDQPFLWMPPYRCRGRSVPGWAGCSNQTPPGRERAGLPEGECGRAPEAVQRSTCQTGAAGREGSGEPVP